MSNPLAHTGARVSGPQTIQSALSRLGVEGAFAAYTYPKRKKVESFWYRPEREILDLLDRARVAYRTGMKQHHPDRGGDPARAAELARSWGTVKRLMAAHGYELA